MRLIFLGPPGAGKGTIAVKAAEEYGMPHISTGEAFRAAIKSGSPLGLKVKGIIESGGLVPDQVTIELVRERLARPDAAAGWILDGFPRTVAQAEALEAMAAPDAAVNFEVEDADVIARLSGRRVCRGCSRNYHADFMPPRTEGVCDDCGGELYVRDDDRPEAIAKRLAVYRAQTEPLIAHYSAKGLLRGIDAAGAPHEVFEALKAALSGLGS
jgi:adenylate kinase